MCGRLSYLLAAPLLIVLCFITSIGCASDKPNLKELDQQIQIEGLEFNKLAVEFSDYAASIQDPCSVEISEVFPDDWIVEKYTDTATGQVKFALAIPISDDLQRGWGVVNIVGETSTTYYQRKSVTIPITHIYVAQTWTGQPYNWGGGWRFPEELKDIRDYPKRIYLDCFTKHKLIKQPYMIPPEASHSVYDDITWDEKHCNITELKNLVSEIQKSNPYQERSFIEEYQLRPISTILDEFQSEIILIKDDIDGYTEFLDNMDRIYFLPNASVYDKHDEFNRCISDFNLIKDQITGIDNYINRIRVWDYSNLEKYKELKAK